MAELTNCPKCDRLFVRRFKEICDVCLKEEEKLFDVVYKFVRKRENRQATISEITKETGVDEDLIMKFVREGRLQSRQFPNLGYKCESCGTLINKGKICGSCSNSLQSDFSKLQKEEARQQKIKAKEKESHTYYAIDEKFRRK